MNIAGGDNKAVLYMMACSAMTRIVNFLTLLDAKLEKIHHPGNNQDI